MCFVVNHKKLIQLKKDIIDESKDNLGEEFQVEEKYRKIARVVVLSLTAVYYISSIIVLIQPFFSKKEFQMPVYVQLPGTK